MYNIMNTVLGIFRPLEKLRDVRAFVSAALANQLHVFSLSCVGKVFNDENISLAAFGLVRIEELPVFLYQGVGI